MSDTKLLQLRIISFLEGFSFLVLLFIAMPLKYIAQEPIYVKYVGMTHGLLFLYFLFALYEAYKEYEWSKKFTLFSFVCAIVPFAPFYLERRLKTLHVKR
jgi:integral membrane protein